MPTVIPKVNPANEFKEIATDFTNPLELIREAISNAFDAKAKNIELFFQVVDSGGERILKITIKDDGEGMNVNDLENFFDLGNSSRKNDPDCIGEKGHGTKVYFNSKSLIIKSVKEGVGIKAEMKNIFQRLNQGEIPPYDWEYEELPFDRGTEISIYGYNQAKYGLFTHDQIKDYILWRTKFGSFEKEFGKDIHNNITLTFKGLDKAHPETISFGHIFPAESVSVERLLDEHSNDATDFFCKKWVKAGNLPNYPHVIYEAVFYVEGKYVKYDYNPMLRRQGYQAPQGAYTIQDRYGLWLCKDYIPVQRKNDWIGTRGTEFTRFHAFFNCQDFRLTANRGSVENTPPEYMQDIESVVKDLYDQIIVSEDYDMVDWLENEVKAYSSKEKEKKEHTKRVRNAYRQNICIHKGFKLVEPDLESGVYALILQLNILEPGLFGFEIIDYNTNTGIDILVKQPDQLALEQSRIMYVELKRILEKTFNHTFEYLNSVICWDTNVKNGDEVRDLGNNKRTLKIVNPANDGDYTKYFLDDNRGGNPIHVFVLKDYLKQKLGLEFRPRVHR